MKGKAKKYCEADGTWILKMSVRLGNLSNISYTDYTDCINNRDKRLYLEHLPRVRLIGKIGFSLSLISLATAMVLLISLK